MTLALYAKNKGMDLQGYKDLQAQIREKARNILLFAKDEYGYAIDSGMYFTTKELTQDVETELLPYVLHEMKNMGFEFIENNEFWRL